MLECNLKLQWGGWLSAISRKLQLDNAKLHYNLRKRRNKMAIVSTTSRGQVTLRKEIFQHVGITPGEKLEIELLPGGEFRGRAVRKSGKIEDVFGMLAGKTKVRLTINEINEEIAEAGADAGMAGLEP
jgi:bifunctional DNA-binding transcriptional regulator/antitoxin component of YhaV-PrlF toxin-antitoxin module